MRGGLGGSTGTDTSLLGRGTALSFALRELVWIVYTKEHHCMDLHFAQAKVEGFLLPNFGT